MVQQHAPSLHHRPPAHRPGRSFAMVNAVTFGVHLLLACFAPDVMATRVWGETTVGVLALLLQAALLLYTAARYDRRAGERVTHEQGGEQ